MNGGKADFDDVYDAPDPRAYLRTLSALDYQIPEQARPVFGHLTEVLRAGDDEPVSVLDLCCSYGINAALLRCGLSLAELYDRYRQPGVADVSSDALADADRRFYADRRDGDHTRFVGLDVSRHAVDYAVRVGLLDAGFAEDLEHDAASAELRGRLADTDLITVTGGIGYITETTVDHVLDAAAGDTPPWVAAFTLRWVDMEPIVETMADHGLVVETVPDRTFRQRRFADATEREFVFDALAARGLDPADAEVDGYHHATLTLARPEPDAATVSATEMLAPTLAE